jgi:outer membrane protein OmpA-like peptidoglycan-associated protein
MPHDLRHVAFLLLAVATAVAPLQARAEEDASPIILAQDTAPPDVEEKKDEKKSKAEEREQRREEKSKQRQERREQAPQGEQNKNQQRTEEQKEKQRERAQQRQQEMERRQQDRVRQDQQRDQKRQEQEAERSKKQQENERQQQDRVRQDQERDQKRQEQEAERTKKQEEKERQQQDRVREDQLRDQKRQEQEAERTKQQQENERQQQERVREDEFRDKQRQEQKARDDKTTPDGARPARDGDRDRRRGPDVVRPPEGTPGVQSTQPQSTQQMSPRDRRRVRSQQIRESYRQAPPQKRSFDELKRNRRERSIADGKLRVIEEPDRRVIVKQDNRTFIRHDESERFRRIAPDARTIRRADGTSTTFMTRSGGVRIYDVTDRHGRLLYRYRRYPGGREVVLIDNRRYYRRDNNRTRDVLIGAGIGLFIGSAIALSAPEVRIPRDEYIVDYGRASDDDLYEALTAPPIERLERGYSLEEIRYSAPLRDRMRRIDLDTVTFDFGSWEVGPDQGRALDRLAEGINRVLARNPDEIFMIEGHTDAVGSQDDNLTLSDRRAQSVAEILTTEYGVAPENLVTQGYGEEHLKVPTDAPERANRRIAVRRIGPLLSGRVDDDRYSGGSRDNDRTYDEDPGFEDGRYEDRR